MSDQRINKAYNRLAAVRGSTAEVEALTRKVVRDKTAPNQRNTNLIKVDRQQLERISHEASQDIVDSDAIAQLLPDVELAEQLIVGSTLSPKDMGSADVSFSINDKVFDGEISTFLLPVVENYFKNTYKIDERLDIVMEDITMRKGAWISVVLPENSIDAMINGNTKLSTESFDKIINPGTIGNCLGLIGHPTKVGVSVESYNGSVGLGISVSNENSKEAPLESQIITLTDNFNVLKGPNYKRKRAKSIINNKLNGLRTSIESIASDIGKHTDSKEIAELFRKRAESGQQTYVVQSPAHLERPSVGHPLALELPVDSVIPVFSPGKPEEHIGYFVPLEHGRPISMSMEKDFYNEMRSAFAPGGNAVGGADTTSELLRMTRQAMGGSELGGSAVELERMRQTYNNIILNNFKDSLRNGIYDEELDVGLTDDVLRIMLYRHWKNQHTQVLFIPVELVTYIAFNYNKNGIGQTLLAKSKIIANMRSILLFAETMNGVRNAVGRKRATIKVDADDPDKAATILDVQNTVLDSMRLSFPLGAPDPSQSLDYLNRAGIDFAIEVNGEDYAETAVTYDEYNTNLTEGNPDLQDRLRNIHVSGMGIPPDKVDPSNSIEYATSLVQSDLLLSRRVRGWQRVLMNGITKFIRTYTVNSSFLVSDMVKAIEDNIGLLTEAQKAVTPIEIVENFINAVEAKLPEPDSARIDQQKAAFQEFDELLEMTLPAYLTEDMFSDEDLGDQSGAYQKAFGALKAYFQRQFMINNNIMPELKALYEMDGETPTFSLLDKQNLAFKTLGSAINEFIKDRQLITRDWRKKYPEQSDESEGSGESSGFGGSDDSNESGSESSSGEFGGSGEDNFDFGDNAGGSGDELAGSADFDFGEPGGEEPGAELEEEGEPDSGSPDAETGEAEGEPESENTPEGGTAEESEAEGGAEAEVSIPGVGSTEEAEEPSRAERARNAIEEARNAAKEDLEAEAEEESEEEEPAEEEPAEEPETEEPEEEETEEEEPEAEPEEEAEEPEAEEEPKKE